MVLCGSCAVKACASKGTRGFNFCECLLVPVHAESCHARARHAKVLGIPKASLDNWVKLSAKGQLKGAGDKPVSAEQMELARLRAQLARVTMERDILKKATAYFARESL